MEDRTLRTPVSAPHPIAAAVLATIAAFALASSAAAQTWYLGGAPGKGKPDTTLTIAVHPLAPGVYAARVRYTWVGWIEQGDGITLVDAAMDDGAAAALEDSIRARSGPKPIRYVVITHNHDDHTLGAKRFLAQGAKLVVQARCAAAVDSALGRPHETKAATKGAEPPTIVVDRIKRLGTGDRVAEIVWLGHPANSAADLIVYLPKQRVIFAGDIISYLAVPWMLDSGMSVPGWKTSIDSLLTSRFDADSLVPGHGQIGPRRTAALWTKGYLNDAWEKASTVAAWGTKVTSYKDWGYLGAYENVEFYRETHFMNMRRLYNEVKGIKTPGRRRARALKY